MTLAIPVLRVVAAALRCACRAPQDCPAQVVSLIQCCLQGDPAARPSAAQVVQVLAQCLPGSGTTAVDGELAIPLAFP